MNDRSPSRHVPADAGDLAAWLAARGPLSAPAALVTTLELCADASALDAGTLARAIGSLETAHILRNADGQWRWRPAVTAVLDRRPSDAEVAGRVGAVLFECLTASPLPDYLPESAVVRTRLRELRPDLPQAMIEVTAQLASARGAGRVTLDEVSGVLRRALGLADGPTRLGRTMWRLAAAVVAMVTLTGAALWIAAPSEPAVVIESHGLTADETVQVDVSTEGGEFMTVSREFITAFGLFEEAARVWRRRVAMDDPRVAQVNLKQAWARTLRGDLLTAEQSLMATVGPLQRALGEGHPYLRAARVALASTYQRRGAVDLARAQTDAAATTARALLPDPMVPLFDPGGAPPTPFVAAHLAPNLPAREGFRTRIDGGYIVPATTVGRWLAGRDGWHLHVAATASCDVAVDVGRDAVRLQVSVRRADDGWRVRVDGVRPPLELRAEEWTAGRVPVTLDATPDGTIRVLAHGSESRTVALDPDAAPSPPHGVAFSGPEEGRGCALVWWEVKPPA